MDPWQSAGPPKGTGAKSSAAQPNIPPEDSAPSLFDGGLEEGKRRRDRGIEAARHNTHPGFRLVVDRVIRQLADSGEEFTAETVRELAGDPLASHPNALSAAMGAAAKAGLIGMVGAQTATRPEAHGRLIRVWKGGGAA